MKLGNIDLPDAYVVPVLLVGIWTAVLKVLAARSGWQRLAQRYGARTGFDGRLHRFQSASMSGVNFNNCLDMGASPRGLYLSPFLLFRFFQKPLLIPWQEICAMPAAQWFFKGYELTFRSFPGVTMRLPAATLDAMLDALRKRGFDPKILQPPPPVPREAGEADPGAGNP